MFFSLPVLNANGPRGPRGRNITAAGSDVAGSKQETYTTPPNTAPAYPPAGRVQHQQSLWAVPPPPPFPLIPVGGQRFMRRRVSWSCTTAPKTGRRTFASTRAPSGWRLARLPSRPLRLRRRAGRRGWGRPGGLGWRGGWCGFGGRGTSCLFLGVGVVS